MAIQRPGFIDRVLNGGRFWVVGFGVVWLLIFAGEGIYYLIRYLFSL